MNDSSFEDISAALHLKATELMADGLRALRDLERQARAEHQRCLTEQAQLTTFLEELDYRIKLSAVQEVGASPEAEDHATRHASSLQQHRAHLRERMVGLNAQAGSLERLLRQVGMLVKQAELNQAFLVDEKGAEAQGSPWELAMRSRTMQAQEEERYRLAREIHDGPAQSLANVILGLEFCERLAERDEQGVVEEIGKLKTVVRQNLAELRRYIFSLRPMIASHGVKPALERFIQEFQSRFAVEVDANLLPDRFANDAEIAIFRIVQEALQNIQKHATASLVAVDFMKENGNLVVSVKDDGRGFDPEQVSVRHANSLGLVSMGERAELLGGKLFIRSRVGHGTEVKLVVPLAKLTGEISVQN